MEYGLVALWLVTYLVLGAVGVPLAAALFERLPDRGAGVALPLSLAVVSVVALWAGRVAFGRVTVAVGLAVLAALALAAVRRADPEIDWPVVGETALVFAGAFLFLVAVRAVDPAVHPLFGEKFLDYGLLKSLLRAETLPPEDMWFAGEPVAYYYGGHLTTSLLTMLTGTAPQYAYNLALAGFYAMYVTAAFGVGGGIAAARGASRRVGGLAAVFFVGVASNLEPAAMRVLALLPDDLARSLAGFLFAGRELDAVMARTDDFGYWGASRVIDGTINEFPLFAWLNGDLHAHMMSTPFLLLVAAALFAYFRTPAAAVGRRRLLLFGVVAPVGGFIGVVNTWSFPSVLGLTALSLLFAPTDPATLLPGPVAERVRALADVDASRVVDSSGAATALSSLGAEAVRVLVAGAVAVAVELVAFVVALPFFVGPASTREIATFPERSSLGGLLLVHGAFLVVVAVYFLSRAEFEDREARLQVLFGVAVAVVVATLQDAAAVGLFVPVVLGAWVLTRRDRDVGFEAALVAGAAGLALVVEFVYVQEQAGPQRMNTVFKTYAQVWLLWAVAAGGMVGSLVATYRARLPWAALGGLLAVGGLRLHDQPWVTTLLAGAAVALAVWLAIEDADADASTALAELRSLDAAVAVNVVVALLVLSTSAYAGLAVDAHFSGNSLSRYQTTEDPTLNATRFVDQVDEDEAAAIRWMDDNIEGQPTIVTGVPAGYRWFPSRGKGAAAPASLTGIPTVLGWFHEIGYRGHDTYRARFVEVNAIYTGEPAQQARLLRKYDVEYVYFGPAERNNYGFIGGQTTIDDLEGVTLYKEWGSVRLYRVNRSALPANETA